MRVPPNGWFIMDNTIQMDDFGASPTSGNLHMSLSGNVGLFWDSPH